jgi:hypothetical protein
MDRSEEILKYVQKSDLGIEIAPWFAPLAAKQDGYNIRVLDVFPTDELVRRAKVDPNIPDASIPRIEAVDFVGSAVEIEPLVRAAGFNEAFDYIISSHNFEHLPNPIKFLRGCEALLKPGGVLSMAIPDYRACFDHFRWPSTIADWLAAYREDRARPRPEQVFAQTSVSCQLRDPPGREGAFFVDDNPIAMIPNQNLREVYQSWLDSDAAGGGAYTDTHCSVLTATSFRLLIAECRFLGLTNLAIKDASGPVGCEFFVHLENQPAAPESPNAAEAFYKLRARLMHQVADEAAQCSAWGWSQLRGEGQTAAVATANFETRIQDLQKQTAAQFQQLQAQITNLANHLTSRPAGTLQRLRAWTDRSGD